LKESDLPVERSLLHLLDVFPEIGVDFGQVLVHQAQKHE
jgi:hypothetical protein